MSHVVDARQAFYLPQSSGVSDAAREVDKMSTYAFLNTKLLPNDRQQVMDELNAVANEYGLLKTYDGLQAYDRALKFIASLPTGIAAPFISRDSDGEIAFDWELDDDMLSVSVNLSGRLSYAVDVHGERHAGVTFVGRVLPDDLTAAVNAFPSTRD